MSSSGWSVESSCLMNSTSATTPIPRPASVGAPVQPASVLWAIPNESATNASGPSTTPSVSSAPAARAAGRSGSARRPTTSASAPIGTFSRKISRQLANSTR